MIERLDAKPDDRFLMLSVPEPPLVAELAARLSSGLIVGLGEDEDVRDARRHARDLENVMFVPGSPDDIPWQASFFTKAVDLLCRWSNPEQAAREIARVLVPGGTVYLANAPAIRDYLPAAGFGEITAAEGLLVIRKHGT